MTRYPLYLLGPRFLPWLIDAPGEGYNVVGQVFDMDAAGLRRVDELEGVGEPHWYRRGSVLVRQRADAGAAATTAIVYFGSDLALQAQVVHVGPIAEYTRVHDDRFRATER